MSVHVFHQRANESARNKSRREDPAQLIDTASRRNPEVTLHLRMHCCAEAYIRTHSSGRTQLRPPHHTRRGWPLKRVLRHRSLPYSRREGNRGNAETTAKNAHSRFKVVLFPLSLWPSSRTLTTFRLRFRLSVSRSILSILSLRFFASCSARSLSSRSSWDSFGLGWRATERGSDIERRRPEGGCMFLFMMEHWKGVPRSSTRFTRKESPTAGRLRGLVH